MKYPVTITAVHVNAAKTADQLMGHVEVSVEIDGKWVQIMHEKFDVTGFHVSHIVEGTGIQHCVNGTGKVSA